MTLPDPPKPVWVACRATKDCTGQQAIVVFKKPNPEGGTVIRYRCITCNKPFHVRF